MKKQIAIYKFDLPQSCMACPLYDGEYERCAASGVIEYGYERKDIVRFRTTRHAKCPLEIEELNHENT